MTKGTHKTLYQILEEAKKRFWARVDKEHPSGCWMWLGARGKNNDEYGGIVFDGRGMYTHRFSWFIHFGMPPDDLLVLHHCDTPGCVRPDHLFLGTRKDNIEDKVKKNRQARQKGEDHGGSKLTDEIVKIIRKDYQKGHGRHPDNAKELAKRFGVSLSAVRSVITRKSWTHVFEE